MVICVCVRVCVGAGKSSKVGVSGCVRESSGGAPVRAEWPPGSHRPAAHTEPAGGRPGQHR